MPLSIGQASVKAPSRWLTYLGLITALITAVVAIGIAVGTTHSNHRFERRQASAQVLASQKLAAREQKYTVYPKLKSDIFDLEKSMLTCFTGLTTPVSPGQPILRNATAQQNWIEQHLVTPVNTASMRLLTDSQVLTSVFSPAVARLVNEMQTKQLQSADICSQFNYTIVEDGNNQSAAAQRDEYIVTKKIKDQMTYLEAEDAKLTNQVNCELQTDG